MNHRSLFASLPFPVIFQSLSRLQPSCVGTLTLQQHICLDTYLINILPKLDPLHPFRKIFKHLNVPTFAQDYLKQEDLFSLCEHAQLCCSWYSNVMLFTIPTRAVTKAYVRPQHQPQGRSTVLLLLLLLPIQQQRRRPRPRRRRGSIFTRLALVGEGYSTTGSGLHHHPGETLLLLHTTWSLFICDSAVEGCWVDLYLFNLIYYVCTWIA